MAKEKAPNWYDETLTEAEKEAPIKSLKLFYKRVREFMEKNHLRGSAWPTIKFDWDTPASTQWLEWLEYFECHVEQVPVTMKEMLDGQRPKEYEFTVPTQFPSLFDPSFWHDPNWKAPERPRYMDDRQMREKIAQLKARFGPNWGIKQMPRGNAFDKRGSYRSLTDDELRAMYGPQNA